MSNNNTNPQIELAFDYVQNTNKNIFLTGKAGTGKTTFLQRVRAECFKRCVVVAPTGVAAINAKGMTIHSCFQLPFGPFIPGNTTELNQRRFTKKKINLIRSIDLLIIDEISMVRADMLDAIDAVLRRFRNRNKPFGGVQLLMVGDLHQLPPVVKNHDWQILKEAYDTSYFFGSKALQLSNPITIELKHIYRQADNVFIDLLNSVRNNKINQTVLDTLNSRYIPNFEPSEDEGYITLSSHNATAQAINEEKLKTLTSRSRKFLAEVADNFPEHAYPTELNLEFKIGAQVMFIKNDTSFGERRYYNGKIGKIVGYEDEIIIVKCPDEAQNIWVEIAEWQNIKYTLNEKTKEVKEEIIGTFRQFPLKLAWAITIHKSQGLTFERAIIDAAAAFAHGQVYVALSRCRSFEGIVLRSPIGYNGVKTDVVVKDYSAYSAQNAPDQTDLALAKKEYEQNLMLELFDFQQIIWAFNSAKTVFQENERALSSNSLHEIEEIWIKTKIELVEVANKFKPWLRHHFLLEKNLPSQNTTISERIKKAAVYFSDKLQKEVSPFIKEISILTDNTKLEEVAKDKIQELQKQLYIKNTCFNEAKAGFSTLKYIKTIADAATDFDAKNTTTAQKNYTSEIKAPKGSLHPKLYIQLVEWRNSLANANGISTYEILPYKVISEIVKFLPTTSETFEQIEGFGKTKLQKYGADIVEIIEKYCAKSKVKPNLSESDLIFLLNNEGEKRDTKLITYKMYEAGNSIAEISKKRGFVESTIEGHLAHFVEAGALDIYELVKRSEVEEIISFLNDKKPETLNDTKRHFGEKFSYGILKMVTKYWKAENED